MCGASSAVREKERTCGESRAGRGAAVKGKSRAGQEMSWAEATKRERGKRRGGWTDQQARPVPGVGPKMRKGTFFKYKSFFHFEFPFPSQFQNKFKYVFDILFISNINEQFW